VLDAIRLGTHHDAAAIIAGQLRELVERLVIAEQRWDGNGSVLIRRLRHGPAARAASDLP
jgi:hypothetical protein